VGGRTNAAMFRQLVEQSRILRKKQTPQESKLWRYLKDKNLEVKFRRQYAINRYIVDFCCPARKLVIELDGGGHADPHQKELDRKRDKLLEANGYRVIRIWNSEIDCNIEGVLEHILRVTSSPSPQPSPQGGEGD